MPEYVIGENRNGEDIVSFTERVTMALPVITTDHAFIHAGDAFSVSGVIESLAAAASTYIKLTTKASNYVHFKPSAFSCTTGPVYVYLAQGGTLGTGVSVTPVNRNRVNPVAASMAVAVTATLTNAGSVLQTTIIPASSSGNNRVGGAANAAEEWVLPKSTTLYFKVLNKHASAAADIGYDLFFYEEQGA